MMEWRSYIFRKLSTDDALVGIVPVDYIFGAGAIDANPDHKPFIVMRFAPVTPGPVPNAELAWSFANVTIWVHDEPGDYARIDTIQSHMRRILHGAVPDDVGGIRVEWTGDSGDLADDGYSTITRNSSFRLVQTGAW